MNQVRQVRIFSQVTCIAVQAPGRFCSEKDCTQDLEDGADAVVCAQTYGPVIALVRAVLRRDRIRPDVTSRCAVSGIEMDFDRYEVKVNSRPVELTRKQFKILEMLISQSSRVIKREEFLTKIWGEETHLEEHTLDVHMHLLRRKIERDPKKPRLLQTVRGIGYKLSNGSVLQQGTLPKKLAHIS